MMSACWAGRHRQALLHIHFLDHGVILTLQGRRQGFDAFVRGTGSMGVFQFRSLFAAFAVMKFACPCVPGSFAPSITRDPVRLDLGQQRLEGWQAGTADTTAQLRNGPTRSWNIVECEIGPLLQI